MKRYCIKCEPGRVEFLDIIRETDNGYHVRVVRVKDGYEKTVDDFMPKTLLDTCLKTGYLYAPAAQAASSVA